MKYKLMFTLVAVALATQVEAQGFLKQIGQKASEAAKKEVVKQVKGILGKESAEQPAAQPSQPTAAPTSAPAASPSQAQSQENLARQVATTVDAGHNIPRQSGLDYIDEYGINHGGGILIAGVVWAPVNCGYHATDYPYGKLYQWGRKMGQGYGAPYEREGGSTTDKTSANILPAPISAAEGSSTKNKNNFYAKSSQAPWNWTKNDIFMWNKSGNPEQPQKVEAYDPCPKGWRVATPDEYHSLIKHSSAWSTNSEGLNGYWYSGDRPYSESVPRIFLPAAGYREIRGGAAGRGNCAYYWTLHHGGGEGLVYHLHYYRRAKTQVAFDFPNIGMSVRCVKE